MNCLYCKGNMLPGTTVFTAQVGDSIVVIKNVPCMECSQCGAVEFDDDVARRLEQIVSKAAQLAQELAVIDYAPIPA